MINLQTS